MRLVQAPTTLLQKNEAFPPDFKFVRCTDLQSKRALLEISSTKKQTKINGYMERLRPKIMLSVKEKYPPYTAIVIINWHRLCTTVALKGFQSEHGQEVDRKAEEHT